MNVLTEPRIIWTIKSCSLAFKYSLCFRGASNSLILSLVGYLFLIKKYIFQYHDFNAVMSFLSLECSAVFLVCHNEGETCTTY